jgi:hypothetical protein
MVNNADVRDQVAEHRRQRISVGTRLLLQRFGTPNFRRSDLFHRLGDLLGILQRPNAVAKVADGRHLRLPDDILARENARGERCGHH